MSTSLQFYLHSTGFLSASECFRYIEPTGSPVDQVCSGMTLTESQVDEAASIDVAWMLARRPVQW